MFICKNRYRLLTLQTIYRIKIVGMGNKFNIDGLPKRRLEVELDVFSYYLANIYFAMAFVKEKLTTKEAEVLAAFMVARDEFDYAFSTEARKYVQEKLGISKAGLSNYIKYIIGKGYIYKDDKGQYKIRESLVPARVGQQYSFVIVNKDFAGKSVVGDNGKVKEKQNK